MKAKSAASVCAVVLALAWGALSQDNVNGSQNDQNPVLKTRPRDDNNNPPTASGDPGRPLAKSGNSGQIYGAPPNAIPDGTRFIIKLKDTLDTKKMEQGKHFKAELREDLTTPSGLLIPRGRSVKGHVGTFEHGYTGSKMQLALDEIETRNGWVPLIGTVTGVPGDPSIKATGEEGEVYRKGPDKGKWSPMPPSALPWAPRQARPSAGIRALPSALSPVRALEQERVSSLKAAI